MGHSVESVIQDSERYLKFLKVVREKYPDAEETKIVGGETVIRSEQAIADVTKIAMFQFERNDEQREVVLLPYAKFGGGRVFGFDPFNPGMYAILALAALKERHRAA